MAQATSAEAASDLPLFYSPFRIAETRFAVLLSLNSQSGRRDPVTRTMLPRWELSFYLFASLGFHFYSFYEVFKVSREHEEELDQEFDLETDSLFGGLKKDPTDFEWSFWMEWGKQRLAWLLLGHVGVSQVANLLARKHRPWILAAYGMWACHCALGTRGTAMVLLHTTISFCVAQFRSLALSWLCSLFLLSTLRLQDVEEVKRGWYETENEYYLLQFTLTVRCLYYTSFSLELCWQQLPAERAFYSFPWMVAYVFYYPVFHNGPILSFPEFLTQMQPREQGSLKASFSILVRGLGRLLFYWWLVELMVHLMYMHAICSSAPLLSAVSCWTLGSPRVKTVVGIIGIAVARALVLCQILLKTFVFRNRQNLHSNPKSSIPSSQRMALAAHFRDACAPSLMKISKSWSRALLGTQTSNRKSLDFSPLLELRLWELEPVILLLTLLLKLPWQLEANSPHYVS